MEREEKGKLILKHKINYTISNVILHLLKLQEEGYTHISTSGSSLNGIADIERRLIDIKHG